MFMLLTTDNMPNKKKWPGLHPLPLPIFLKDIACLNVLSPMWQSNKDKLYIAAEGELAE